MPLKTRGKRGGKSASKTAREKRRSSEKRKEKSRDAARWRRGKESEIFNELASALPISKQAASQLDKASIMRLAIAYLKMRALCQTGISTKLKYSDSSKDCVQEKGKGKKANKRKLEDAMDSLLLEAMDGFLLVLSTDGDVVYTSDNITTFLGLSQVDVVGQSLFEYTHPCDHEELRDLASMKAMPDPRHVFLRLKCTLTTKGRSANLKSASYKVVKVSGEVVRSSGMLDEEAEEQAWLVAIGTPVPHPSNIEIPLDKQTFLSRHSLDMKFTYVDENIERFCRYSPDDLVGRSLYELHHALDSDLVRESYKTLRSKGQVETGQYRFLAKGGGYVWVVTQATLITGAKDQRPQHVVCLNYAVSGVEACGEILSEIQLLTESEKEEVENSASVLSVCKSRSPVPPVYITVSSADDKEPVPVHVKSELACSPRYSLDSGPVPDVATSKLFTHRTDDMSKGFLIFPDDNTNAAVLKDDPDDLTHLAPSVGDACDQLQVPTLYPVADDILNSDDSVSFLTVESPVPVSSTASIFQSLSPVYTPDWPTGSEQRQESSFGFGGRDSLTTKLLNSPVTTLPRYELKGCSVPGDHNYDSRAGDVRSPSLFQVKTPEPTAPLLSQAATPNFSDKNFQNSVSQSNCPVSTTASSFTPLDECLPSSSTMDIFSAVDFKFDELGFDNDEFAMRAPYIPLIDEILPGADDMKWDLQIDPGSLSPLDNNSYRKEGKVVEKTDSNLAQLLKSNDPPLASVSTSDQPKNGSSLLHIPFQSNRISDGGGGGACVDPNKVLPGHSMGTGQQKENFLQWIDSDSDEIPVVLVADSVESSPPPLLSATKNVAGMKRKPSPFSSPQLSRKKLCHLQQGHQQQPQNQSPNHSPALKTDLPTPNTPIMQQLLAVKNSGSILDKNKSNYYIRSPSGQLTPVLLEQSTSSSSLSSYIQVLPTSWSASSTGTGPRSSGCEYSLAKMKVVSDHPPRGRIESITRERWRGIRRQDPLLLMNSDVSIPTLLDLTQLDCEVNAPTNASNLLQGSDLLMALDQSL